MGVIQRIIRVFFGTFTQHIFLACANLPLLYEMTVQKRLFWAFLLCGLHKRFYERGGVCVVFLAHSYNGAHWGVKQKANRRSDSPSLMPYYSSGSASVCGCDKESFSGSSRPSRLRAVTAASRSRSRLLLAMARRGSMARVSPISPRDSAACIGV